MRLSDLVKAIPELLPLPDSISETQITGITSDSNKVKPGFVFVALKGEKTDGGKFIPQAEQNGAVVVISSLRGGEADVAIQQPDNTGLLPATPSARSRNDESLPHILVQNPRLALAKMAAAFYEKQPENIVAITGTDGKTSTADFFRQLMYLAGKKSASVGTIGVIVCHPVSNKVAAQDLVDIARDPAQPTAHRMTGLTTPDSVALHKMLAEMAEGGVDYLAMEASSHGLSQYRLDGVDLKAAAFTNIARDHLDYHKTEEAYFIAKARLFSELLPERAAAVLNQDDRRYGELKAICEKRGHKIICFGRKGSDFTINSITPTAHGQHAELTLFDKKYSVEVPLVGEFQVMNILAALGLAVGCGADLEKLLSVVGKLKGVSGRLEQVVTTKNGAAVFIDYAHTPMALENILRTLRPHTKNKLHVVFGCGGDRDAGKRPLMGKIASEFADFVIVTDDNPRSENPETIRAAIMVGISKEKNCKEVADRAQAIYLAIQQLQAGDILVLAGKGHEKVQIIGDKNLPFDDAEIARNAARDLGVAT